MVNTFPLYIRATKGDDSLVLKAAWTFANGKYCGYFNKELRKTLNLDKNFNPIDDLDNKWEGYAFKEENHEEES